MNGRNLSRLIKEWAEANLVEEADLRKLSVDELLDMLYEDKY